MGCASRSRSGCPRACRLGPCRPGPCRQNFCQGVRLCLHRPDVLDLGGLPGSHRCGVSGLGLVHQVKLGLGRGCDLARRLGLGQSSLRLNLQRRDLLTNGDQVSLDGPTIRPHGVQPAQRRTADPHDGVHHDQAVGEVFGAGGLQRDRQTRDTPLLVGVSGHVAELVLGFRGVAGVPGQRLRGLGLLGLSDRQRGGHVGVVPIRDSLCGVGGSKRLLRAGKLPPDPLQLDEGIGEDLGGVLERKAQLDDVGVELLLVPAGVGRAHGCQTQRARDSDADGQAHQPDHGGTAGRSGRSQMAHITTLVPQAPRATRHVGGATGGVSGTRCVRSDPQRDQTRSAIRPGGSGGA